MVRYLALLLVLLIVLSGCVVVHSEKQMAMTCVSAEASSSAALLQ